MQRPAGSIVGVMDNWAAHWTPDAREQAEREHLMLEPEEPLEEMEEEIIGYPMDDPMDETADWKDLLYPKVVTIQSIE